jgi:hypothetical protein
MEIPMDDQITKIVDLSQIDESVGAIAEIMQLDPDATDIDSLYELLENWLTDNGFEITDEN